MKRILGGALSVVLMSAVWTSNASAATEAQKLTAILNGLAHLDKVQCATAGANFGSWATTVCGGGYSDAFTGMAVFAMQTQKAKWPAAQAATYALDVTNGINYLLSVASKSTVSKNSNNVNICPGGAASCTAIYWSACTYSTYCTGFVAPAIDTYALQQGIGTVATATGPLAGLTWTQIAQGITNAYAAAQATVVNGHSNGGWRYYIPSGGDADMSTAQWGAIASGYNESVGAVTPANVKPALSTYLAYDIDTATNAACYEGSAGCGIGPSNSENGAWLVSNAWAGGNLSTAGPIAFLNTNWKVAPNGEWYGNMGHTYAMWSTYKGLEASIGLNDTTHITNLNSACGAPNNLPGSGICNWWEDYNDYLVNSQTSTDAATNKFWPGYNAESGWQDPMSTAVDISILGAVALPNTITQGPPPVSVPAVSKWGLVGLGIMLLTFAAMKLRAPRTV